jgi:hypothetical protein
MTEQATPDEKELTSEEKNKKFLRQVKEARSKWPKQQFH